MEWNGCEFAHEKWLRMKENGGQEWKWREIQSEEMREENEFCKFYFKIEVTDCLKKKTD